MGWALVVLASGCGRINYQPLDPGFDGGGPGWDAAELDAAELDAAGLDAAGLDASGLDASAIDAGVRDAGPLADASGTDAGARVDIVVNGDAEAAPGSLNGSAVPTPGWTSSGDATAVQYGIPNYPTATDPGPSDRGANFLAGGRLNRSSSLAQDADVSAYAARIDAGLVGATLTGWLGGWLDQPDPVPVTASFLDGTGAALGTAVIGPITVADRGGLTGLVQRTASRAVPPGTRTVRILIEMERQSGQSADGYVDELELWLEGL
ncbi:MAG: hypothetical protein IT378_20275 [Sandaracinaceae bacterium]|nr:hypothetical protein [Sandaracinaceae bacterium]